MIDRRSHSRTFVQEVMRSLGIFGVWYVLATVFLTGVHFRLLKDRQWDVIDDTAAAAGVVCGLAGPFMAFLLMDRGSQSIITRSRKLPLVALVVVPISALLSPLGLFLWRPIIGEDAPAGSVYDVITSSPMAWLFVFVFALTAFAWGRAFCMPMFAMGLNLKLRLAVFLPLCLVSVFLWPYLATKLLAEPPSGALVALFAVASVLMLGIMVGILHLVQGARRPL